MNYNPDMEGTLVIQNVRLLILSQSGQEKLRHCQGGTIPGDRGRQTSEFKVSSGQNKLHSLASTSVEPDFFRIPAYTEGQLKHPASWD